MGEGEKDGGGKTRAWTAWGLPLVQLLLCYKRKNNTHTIK